MINDIEEWKKQKVKEQIEQIDKCLSVKALIQEIIQIAGKKNRDVSDDIEKCFEVTENV